MTPLENHHEHILVCLSSAPSNYRIIQTAGTMAEAYQCKLTALYVETPGFSEISTENMARLQKNIDLAKSYGASIEQVIGEDVSFQIAEFARLNGVSKIVIGRSTDTNSIFRYRKSLTDRLILQAPDVEIFIIPDANNNKRESLNLEKKKTLFFSVQDIIKTILILFAATSLSILFYQMGFTDANIVTIYILGVLFISLFTEHMALGVIASVASVFIFNYLFTDPRYTLLAYDIGYPMTFLVMLNASLITSTLASRLKQVAKQSAKQAYRTKILLDTNQSLQQAEDKDEIIKTTIKQISKLTRRDLNIYYEEDSEKEMISISSGKIQKNYYPIKTGMSRYGTIVIEIEDNPIDLFENSIILSILGECALALENEKNAKEKKRTEILAQKEQLRANLLRSISHDLRTPLTTISGNASNLMTNEKYFDEETKQQLYTDIYDDSMWLFDLVENLLSITRMDGEDFRLNLSAELVSEVIEEALTHLDRRSIEHRITVDYEDELLMARMDSKLILQVIINLMNNAIKYTHKGSLIEIKTYKLENYVAVSIADDGNGIEDSRKEKIFEMFHTGEINVTDGRRSLGLGLALCKSIVEAHHGEIHVEDSIPHGSNFIFTLPIEEVHIHE